MFIIFLVVCKFDRNCVVNFSRRLNLKKYLNLTSDQSHSQRYKLFNFPTYFHFSFYPPHLTHTLAFTLIYGGKLEPEDDECEMNRNQINR